MRNGRACDRCLGRAWLLARLAGHLELERARIEQALTLDEDELIAAVGGQHAVDVRRELAALEPDTLRAVEARAGLEAICGCDPGYPARLAALPGAPAVLHVGGGLDRFLAVVEEEPVAIVGTRRPSRYGVETARSLARGLARAGVPVISGMAFGVDSAAHSGALAGSGVTVAVLAGGADRPYPASKRALHVQIARTGAVISELPAGTPARRWMFPARNRIIAALAEMTVVVEARHQSGALLTAQFAAELGRPVGAVPGPISSPLASGPNGLLANGAQIVRGPQDVLDALFGAGVRSTGEGPPAPPPELRRLLAAIAEGYETDAAVKQAGYSEQEGLAALAALELSGHVRRGAGGRYAVAP